MGHVAAWMVDLQDLRIGEITQAHAQRIVDDYLRVEGNTAGGANAVLCSLRLLIGFAVKRGYITHRPFRVELLDVQEKPKPRVPAERMAEFFLTLQAQGAPLRAQRLCWLMMTLGLRESEGRHARIEYTDLVNRWHTPYDPEVGTKGGEARPVRSSHGRPARSRPWPAVGAKGSSCLNGSPQPGCSTGLHAGLRSSSWGGNGNPAPYPSCLAWHLRYHSLSRRRPGPSHPGVPAAQGRAHHPDLHLAGDG